MIHPSLQINCENFIMGCTLGFQTILNQTLAFATLDKNWVAHAHYLIVCPYDAKYRMQESKNKLELFYWLFIRFFCHAFSALGLKTCLNRVWNYCYRYWSHLNAFQAQTEVVFASFQGY